MNELKNSDLSWKERMKPILKGVPETKGKVDAERYGWEQGYKKYREKMASKPPNERWGRLYE